MSVTAITLITDALEELNIVQAGQTPEAGDADRVLRILNRDIMDRWNAIRPFATTRVITSGTFLANTATRTIGPTGAYVLTPRPIELLNAEWVDTNDQRIPISIQDEHWYASLPDPEQTDANILQIAYFPTTPNGTMYPWPIPTGNVTVELETRSVLAQFTVLTTTADFAPGYESAVVQTLKELVCDAWGKPYPPGLPGDALKARNAVMSVNMVPPRICSNDIQRPSGDYFDTKTRRNLYT